MAIHTIIYLPDPRLRIKSAKIEQFDDPLQTLIDDMFETMYDARGVGLAAPQIGINISLSVIDILGDKTDPLVIINPEIIESHGTATWQEGCLSVPGSFNTVTRAERVIVRAQDRFGKPIEIKGEGHFAECLQHEIDHLHGKLYIDLLSPLKRAMAKKKLDKFKRQARR